MAPFVTMGMRGIGKGKLASIVPPGETPRGGGGLRGEDFVGGSGEILKELIGGPV